MRLKGKLRKRILGWRIIKSRKDEIRKMEITKMKHRDCFVYDYVRLLAMTKTAACTSQLATRNPQHVTEAIGSAIS